MSNVIAIAATEAKEAVVRAGVTDTRERLKVAFQATRSHWLVVNENDQFLAGVAAVFTLSDEDTKESLQREIKLMQCIAQGHFHELAAIAETAPEGWEAIGLQALWKDGQGADEGDRA